MSLPEDTPGTREYIADQFAAFSVESPGDASFLIRAAGDTNQYKSVPLLAAEDAAVVGVGTPKHWFFALPHPEYETGLLAVEFGSAATLGYGISPAEARFSHEFAVDHALQMNMDSNPSVAFLYKQVGGHLVKRVRDAGHLFYAGIEVTYAEDDDGVKQWTQLVYSKVLGHTTDVLRSAMARPPETYPAWLQSAAQPLNKWQTAEDMALSGLAAARDIRESE